MTRLLLIITIALASARVGAQTQGAPDTVNKLATSAEQRLASSMAELSALRERIAAEKLPLAQELSSLEDRLTELRREHERVTRMVDSGSLETAGIKTEIKARQDELTYIGNLLDEYARSFDSKIHVSEMQKYGPAIDAAKQATEDKDLSPGDKFARQVAFVDVTVERLFDAVGGMKFEGEGVDVQGTVSKGEFALFGPVALFSGDSGATTGVVLPQSGSTRPLIRPLEGAMQAGITTLVSDGEGLLPLDPSRGAALKALVQKFNIIHIFEKGGPIMWPLLVASIIALAVVIERLFFLLLERFRRSPKAMDRFFGAVTRGNLREATEIGQRSRFFVVRALGYALAHKETSLANALIYAQAQELKRYQRGISVLDTVITLAPLLGLLGTVTGMMGSFSLIGGELSSPGAITGGIAEALIATAFGLGIAITALLPFNFLNTKTEQARHEIESAATQLELLVGARPADPVAAMTLAMASTGAVNGTNGTSGVRQPAHAAAPHADISRDELERQLAELKQAFDQRSGEIQRLISRERGGREPAQHLHSAER